MKKCFGTYCLFVLSLLLLGTMYGCVKLDIDDNPDPSIVFIPKGFDWKTVKEVFCTITVGSVSGIGDNGISVIRIYNDVQLSEGALIAVGAATPSSPFVVNITVAAATSTIYVQEILPDGSSNILTKEITGNSLNFDFIATTPSAPIISKASSISAYAANMANVVVVDNDGDGVASGLDVDDSDPTVAFASYFPSAGTWGTYAFEDLWPVKGDYDVNDLVLGFKITYFTNASNLVTKFRLDYNMKGAGSTYNLGAAFQLDNIAATNVQSVSGRTLSGSSPFAIDANGCESGVSLAVIPLLNNQKDFISYSGYLNTVSGTHLDTPDEYVSVKFVTPFQQSNIAMNSFNVFIVANTRAREIHLPTYAGTSKFDPLLASGYDLYSGDQFKNSDGMMWGIMIPEPFEYPAECSSILQAFLHFAEWATSGGAIYTDWYKSTAGNKNMAFIYQWQVPGSGPPTDFEGYVYPSVTIGTQVWMAENLKTTCYNDGTVIPNVTATASWTALTTGAYCNYNNSAASAAIYGKLYNWYVVDNNAASKIASNGGKNICPIGWHAPSEAEWTTLINYLGGSSAGGKLKETGTAHWLSPNTGATNVSGFTALPGGVRYPTGFQNLTSNGNWWSTTIYARPVCRVLYSGNSNVLPGFCEKNYGYSVRCVKD